MNCNTSLLKFKFPSENFVRFNEKKTYKIKKLKVISDTIRHGEMAHDINIFLEFES
jgi:hypothetical protein